MLSFQAEGDLDSVVEAMNEARTTVVTGEVTTAVRSVEIDGVQVKEGQVIGLVDGKLAVSGDSLPPVVTELLEKMSAHDREVITMYYGDHVTKTDAESLADTLKPDYTDQEFDVIFGGQPHYHYIISAE
jgi:dihydroxyacetone kinase-like predicted kinase